MRDDTQDSTPLDLETAYREALQAVNGTDLDGLDVWDSPSGQESAGDDQAPAIAKDSEPSAEPERVTPRQILEAALFVGGIELTADKLASLLKGDFTAEAVVRLIEDLNRRYESEERPYEIRREENLYRLALRDEFEPLRRRVYGLGPKEVKLSQDALEVLSLIGYRQPISREAIESLREGNAGNILRQLVRRGLIAIERQDAQANYLTTDRFLEVFGLTNLAELPRAESLEFK